MSVRDYGTGLDGKVAIVTGAAQNIGSVIAKMLAGAGASVVVNYLTSAEAAAATVSEIEADGGSALSHCADIRKFDEVEAMVAETVSRFGGVDILVNNANIRSYRPLPELTAEEWRATMETSLDGFFFCVKNCAPHMIERGGGTIVNIGGGSGHSGVANRCHVATAKAGIAGMTGALAAELAPHNITVNCIVPGRVDTAKKPSGDRNEHRTGRGDSPMGRSAEPEEIADLALYLCAGGCRYMSGQMLHVNGARYVTIA
ncbi:MAG: SDR family oxidoreductase [Alphaproteobacteria bacterium]|nr:SDR family oxidoreductase [Alphaproteobacteria bacterium]